MIHQTTGALARPAARQTVPNRVHRTPDATAEAEQAGAVPDYLRAVYRWAYVTPLATKLLDRQLVVQAILWGNAQRLIDDVLAELRPGDRVFQPAAVYGTFSSQVAARLGPSGRLDVRDI